MTDAQSNAAGAPRMNPGVQHAEVEAKRQQIAADLEGLNGTHMVLTDTRDGKLEHIEQLKREVAEFDAALEALQRERDDLIAMNDALAEEQLALERILVRRAGR